jgi:hypothetical protein
MPDLPRKPATSTVDQRYEIFELFAADAAALIAELRRAVADERVSNE